MKTTLIAVSILLSPALCSAQELLISGARIFDGTGAVLDDGSILIRNGRIVEVSEQGLAASDGVVIDPGRMTVMPGMINTHWHLLANSGASNEAEIAAYAEEIAISALDAILDRGVTTIMSTGDPSSGVLAIRDKLSAGEVRGPRLLVTGAVFTAPGDWPSQLCPDAGCRALMTAEVDSEQAARDKVRELASLKVDALKFVYDDIIAPDVRIDDEVVAAIADEANRFGLRLLAHVSTVDDTALSLIDLGVRGYVHSDQVRGDSVHRLRELQIPVSTTLAVFLSRAEWAQIGTPDFAPTMFGDVYLHAEKNVRTLWDEGVTVAFGTDSVAGPESDDSMISSVTMTGAPVFDAELRALSQVLTNEEILISLTRNAAEFIGMQDQIGTIEEGKIADVIVVDGDPLTNLADLQNVVLVVQGGRIVYDNR